MYLVLEWINLVVRYKRHLVYTLEPDLIALGLLTQQQQPVRNQPRSLCVRVNTTGVYDLIHKVKLEREGCGEFGL